MTAANGSFVKSTSTIILDDTVDDWVDYPGSGTTWGSGNLNRRAAGTGELPAQPTSIGAVGQKVRGNGSGTRNATYVNGTLGASGTSTGGGIFTQGTGTFAAPQGMNLAVPAAATPRGLTLYAFNKDGTAEVRLTFASGGGTTTVPLTSAAAGVTDWYVITIQYQSDTPTTLNVALVQTAVNSGADITAQMGLQAMTLKTLTPVSVTPGVTAQNATVAVASVENFPASLAVTAQNAASAFALSNVATSPDNTTVTTAGPTITDSNLNQWSLTADGHVQLNGANTSTGSPAPINLLLWWGGHLYARNSSGTWFSQQTPPWAIIGGDPRANTSALTVTAQSATTSLAVGENFPASIAVAAQDATASLAATGNYTSFVSVSAQDATTNLAAAESFPTSITVAAQDAVSTLGVGENFPAAIGVTAKNATIALAVTPPGTATVNTTVSTATQAFDTSFNDWIIYPGNGTDWTVKERLAGGTGEISTPALVGTSVGTVVGNGSAPRRITWTGGTPDATGSETGGIHNTNTAPFVAGRGLSFTVPAGPAVRTLTICWWNHNGSAQLSLQIGSAAATVTQYPTVSGSNWYFTTVTYSSFSPATMTVSLTQDTLNGTDATAAYIGLQAIGLATGVPSKGAISVTAQNAVSALAASESFPTSITVAAQSATANLAATNVIPPASASLNVQAANATSTFAVAVQNKNATTPGSVADNAKINLLVHETFVVGAQVQAANATSDFTAYEVFRVRLNVAADNAVVQLFSVPPNSVGLNVTAQNATTNLHVGTFNTVALHVTAQNATSHLGAYNATPVYAAISVQAQDAVVQRMHVIEFKRRFQAAILGPQ